MGAMLGVALAMLGLRLFRALAPVNRGTGTVVSINVGVLAFAVGVGNDDGSVLWIDSGVEHVKAG